VLVLTIRACLRPKHVNYGVNAYDLTIWVCLQFVVRIPTAMPVTTDLNVPVLLTFLETHSHDATPNVLDTTNVQPLWYVF
jgi:hypothetical protein